MSRSRRIAVDQDNSWDMRAYYSSDPNAGSNGTVDHGDVDYLLFTTDGSGDEQFGMQPPLYGSTTEALSTFTVWGKGVISFGPPTDAQIAFIAQANASTDFGKFPGRFLTAGFQDPVNSEIFVGFKPGYTEVSYGAVSFEFYGDHVHISNGAGIIDLGTGVRFTPADAVNGDYHLASLIVVDGDDNDNVINGTYAAQTIYGHGGNDTITAGLGASDLYGNDGNDTLVGGQGYDRIYGGDGKDTITAGDRDTVDAGIGDDVIFARGHATIAGGEGTDRLVLDYTNFPLNLVVAVGDGPDGTEANHGTVYTGIELIDIVGGQGNDILTGNSGANRIMGGAGADTITGGGGNDDLDAGVGGQAPEPPVSDGGPNFASSVGIDGSFNPLGNGSPVAVLLTRQQPFGSTDQFYYFTAGDNAHLQVFRNDNSGTLDGYSISILDPLGNLVADNSDTGSVDVTLSAGTYIIELLTSYSGNDYFDTDTHVLLSTASPPKRVNTLIGGTGDDTYRVHASSDVIVEKSKEGTDSVIADVSYALSSNVENLTLTGTGALRGTGNASANTIRGNEGANAIHGGNGTDTIYGNGGNDILNGDGGADTMIGGKGDDTFMVDDAGDTAIEKAGEGNDRVASSVSFALGANIEKLQLTGANAINGTGNGLANTITGNGADNVLDGGAGNDILLGGAGSDTYIVDVSGDRVYETASMTSTVDAGGTDTVIAGATYTLAAAGRQYIEVLRLSGSPEINGTGNELGNRIYGNGAANRLYGNGGADTVNGGGGNDLLYGGTGNDILIGGAGNDRLDGGTGKDAVAGGTGADLFIFTAAAVSDAPSVSTADRVSDFSHAEGDRIDLRGIDAVAGGADDAFAFIGTAAFTRHAGELRSEKIGSATFLSGDTNGDGIADFYIRFDGAPTLVKGDLLL